MAFGLIKNQQTGKESLWKIRSQCRLSVLPLPHLPSNRPLHVQSPPSWHCLFPPACSSGPECSVFLQNSCKERWRASRGNFSAAQTPDHARRRPPKNGQTEARRHWKSPRKALSGRAGWPMIEIPARAWQSGHIFLPKNRAWQYPPGRAKNVGCRSIPWAD